MNQPQSAEFFQVWDTYAKVVAANYMYHREIGAGVRAALSSHFIGRPFSILDLGCGDAATFAPLLEGLPVKSYCGVDLSAAALDIARLNLAGLPCPIAFVQSDLMTALSNAEPADAIYTSFALHHLRTNEKREFFRLAASKIRTGGLLLVADVNRREGETLPDYYNNYCAWLRETMTSLTPSEQEGICDHLTNNDFPEATSEISQLAASAGLREIGAVRPHQWHGLATFGVA